MNTKHTPGPWYSRVSTDGTITVGPSGPRYVVEIPPSQMLDRDANALLIAAAPDLLEALRGLMVDAPRLGTKYPIPARWQKAYDALAKADGK